MRKTSTLICYMELYLGYLNLLLAWVSQFRLKLLKGGAMQLLVPEPGDLIYMQSGFKDRAMPTACKEPYRPPALQQMWGR